MTPDPEGRTAFFKAMMAFAGGRNDEAIAQMQIADGRRMTSRRYPMVFIGRAHDLAGRPDSAIVWLERYVSTPDADLQFSALYDAGSYKRLGELYEAKGDTAKAIANYEKFIDLWKNAEPALQPKVREVRARLERLRPAR
jgi:tetratricopeptide (TPR) repeat protein